MAYTFLTASKDATVYLQQPNQNTGLDEILEISKIYYGNVKDVSRALIRFDITSLSSSLSSGLFGMQDAHLILKETKSEELPLEYTLYGFMVSGSWQMGKGTRFDDVSTQGVTWNYREGDSNLEWLPTNQFANGSTGSYEGRGGVWYSTNATSQSFSYQSADIQMDVKNILKLWMSGSIQNNGLIIKHSNSVEDDTEDYGIVKLYSKETNTIYKPKIRVGWNDQSFVTGSLEALSGENIKIFTSNLKTEYKLNTIVKIRIGGRELYPLKTFTDKFSYNTTKYLPQNSYYQIKDASSEDIIIPFSDYSKISCDSEGNYIKLNFSNWESDRIYKIEFKVDMGNGDVHYFDNDLTFTILKD